MNETAGVLACSRSLLGEGPRWHPLEECIYWVDIDGGRLLRCQLNGAGYETVLSAGPIGGFTIQEDGRMVLLMEAGTLRVYGGGQLQEWRPAQPQLAGMRWNDALADSTGRVFSGSIEAPGRAGVLCRIELDGKVQLIRSQVGCSNGMGLSPDETVLYHTDSFAREVRAYDYEVQTGQLSAERTFASFRPEDGLPDGLAIDAEGCVWIAFWDGACLRRLSPEGRELRRIQLPAQRVTSLTFGGPDGTDIFVTTAGGNDPARFGAEAGNLLHLNLGIKGRRHFFSRLLIPPAP